MKRKLLKVFIRLGVLTVVLISSAASAQETNWVQQIGGFGSEGGSTYQGKKLAVDAAGNVYTASAVPKVSTQDVSVPVMYETAGGNDIYISKHKPDGALDWIKFIGGTGEDIPTAIALDSSGDLYVTGSFSGTVDFDPDPNLSTMAVSGGGTDAFILKLSTEGIFQWVKTISSSGAAESGFGIAIDGNKDIILVGHFNAASTVAVDFDSDPIGSSTLNAVGNSDVFILKLNQDGVFKWVKQVAGAGADNVYSIAIGSANSIHVTGAFASTATFNLPNPANAVTIDPGTGSDAFVLKLAQNGDLIWVKNFAASGNVNGNGIAVDSKGDVFVTGFASGTSSAPTNFNAASGTPLIIPGMSTGTATNDIFIAKLNGTNGEAAWAKIYGATSGHDVGYDIATDGFGNVYSTGYIRDGIVDFKPSIPSNTAFELNSNGEDGFVLRLNSSDGESTWVRHISSSGTDRTLGIAVHNWNVYTMGIFGGVAVPSPGTFDPIYFGEGNTAPTLTKIGGSWDMFVLKLGQSTLPITLSEFSGVATQNGNLIKWSTSSEINNSHFLLERSADGISFSSIKQIDGSINSTSKKTYSHLDAQPLSGVNYYRLKQVDLNGQVSYSNIIYVNQSLKREAVLVYPNPTSNSVTIEPVTAFQNAIIKIVNATGQLVYMERNISGLSHTVDISHFNKGIYFVEFTANGAREKFKVVKN